jgi:hypothetical protein
MASSLLDVSELVGRERLSFPRVFDRAEDQESRISAALRLVGDRLPQVSGKWLRRYFEYLAGRLKFPFRAEFSEGSDRFCTQTFPIIVTALVPPAWDSDGQSQGLLCRARKGVQEIVVPLAEVEVESDDGNFQLIEDYWFWFWNWSISEDVLIRNASQGALSA